MILLFGEALFCLCTTRKDVTVELDECFYPCRVLPEGVAHDSESTILPDVVYTIKLQVARVNTFFDDNSGSKQSERLFNQVLFIIKFV